MRDRFTCEISRRCSVRCELNISRQAIDTDTTRYDFLCIRKYFFRPPPPDRLSVPMQLSNVSDIIGRYSHETHLVGAQSSGTTANARTCSMPLMCRQHKRCGAFVRLRSSAHRSDVNNFLRFCMLWPIVSPISRPRMRSIPCMES